MNEADQVTMKLVEPSRVVKNSLEELKLKLLGKVLSGGDKVGAFEVHSITPNKSKVTENTNIMFEDFD